MLGQVEFTDSLGGNTAFQASISNAAGLICRICANYSHDTHIGNSFQYSFLVHHDKIPP